MRFTPLLLTGLLALAASTAHARDFKAGSIEVTDPWSRATPRGASAGAGYMKITNTGTTPDRLVSESSDIARSVELRETSMENGIARMRPLKNGLEIKPGETVELKPEGYHLMFLGLKQPLKQGERVDGTLQFEHAGSVQVQYAVGTIGQKAPTAQSSMPGMAPNTKTQPGMQKMR